MQTAGGRGRPAGQSQDPAYEELAQEAAALRQDLNVKEYELYQKEKAARVQNSEAASVLQTYSEQLEGDKQHWIRKMNSLLVDKDRLNKEKAELLAQLHEERLRNEELEHKAKYATKKKAGDRVVHSELKSEKDENSRLRDLVHRLEVERAELRAKVRDYEQAQVTMAREQSDLTLKLTQEQDRVTLMENDTKSLLEQIRALKVQLSDFESEHAALLHERASMRETISHLEAQHSDAISHSNELSAKHENYIFAMNNEKDNLQWIHRRHTRLLASRSIALELSKLVNRRCLSSFNYIQGFAAFVTDKSRSVSKLFWVFQRYNTSATKRAVDKWRSALNWTGKSHIQQAFTAFHDRKSTLTRFWSDWRAVFLYRTRVKGRHRSAIDRVFRFYSEGMRGMVRRRLARWRGKNEFHNERSERAKNLVKRGVTGKLRSAVGVWREFMFAMRKEQAKEDISTEFSSLLLSQAVLSSWKTVIFRQKASSYLTKTKEKAADRLHNVSILHGLQRYVSTKRAKTQSLQRVIRRLSTRQVISGFNTWKKEVKAGKALKNMELVLGRQHYKRYFVTFEKTFYAWKNYYLTQKHATVSGHLATEIPVRQELEAKLHQVTTDFTRVKQAKAMRVVGRWLNQELFSYFRHWSKSVPTYKVRFHRMVRIVSQWQRLQTNMAFARWRQIQSNADLTVLVDRNRELQGDNVALVEHVNNLEMVLQHKEEQFSGMTSRRLKATVGMLARFGMKSAMRRWARIVLSQANKHSCGLSLERTLHFRLLTDGFSAIKDYSFAKSRSENRKNRLRYHTLLKWRGTMAESFYAWKHLHGVLKRVKGAFRRLSTRRDLFYKQKGINRWSDAVAEVHLQEHRHHTHQTNLKNDSLEQTIVELTAQLQAQTTRRAQLEKSLTKKSRSRLVNAIHRALHFSLYKGFKSWSDHSLLLRKREGKTRLLHVIHSKIRLRRAVRTWQRGANELKTDEFTLKVTTGQRETKDLRRVMKGNQEQLESIIAEKEQEIQSNEDVIATLNNRLQFLLERTVKSQDEEYSMSKAGYIFKFWSNRYRLMKASLTRLTHVAYRSVMKNGMYDLKVNQREVDKDRNYRRVVRLWMDTTSARYLRASLSLWLKNAHGTHASHLSALVQTETQKNVALQANIKSMKNKATMKVIAGNDRFFTLQVVREWGKIASKLRHIRLSHIKFVETSRNFRFQLAFTSLKEKRVKGRVKQRKIAKALTQYFVTMQRTAFYCFQSNAKDNKLLRALFTKLARQFTREKLLFSIGKIQEIAATHRTNSVHFAENRIKALSRMLSSVHHWKEAKALRTWKTRSVIRRQTRHNFKKAMVRGAVRKLFSAFSLWKDVLTSHQVDLYYNTEGPVAVENSLLKERLTIYSSLVQDEGLDPKHVERYILERESMAGALRRKGIARMQYAAKIGGKAAEDQNQVLPRALLRWKVWVAKRLKVKRLARRMMTFRKNGEMLGAFLKWKKGLPLVRNSLANYTRVGLISLIAKMDHDIKTLESLLESQNEKLRFMQAYGSLLEQHTRRGRNQSISVLSASIQNPMSKALSRWTAHVTSTKITELKSTIVELDDELHLMHLRYEEMEKDYKQVFVENNELRQATLDGLEIADAIEALSREREKLSVDLADRAVTIKKLLEENGELAARLRNAQKEAETLKLLTTPAEREVRYDTQRRM